ncbi:transposase [Chitinophaga silvisoli]|uniref:Transposase n=1 Tax=Chitinophaga silvisoli TaxID=2291814 RepID=A0A3E1P3J8_9BACT|nr:transposase [Chitinophaga silvisoli]RFM34759.1 transposase [Chitinophaga silvisoli]
MSRWENLTDDQWAIIKQLITETPTREDGKGRSRIHSDREILNKILWILRTGASWIDLPGRFSSSSTCCKRFSSWSKSGVLSPNARNAGQRPWNKRRNRSIRMFYRWHLCGGKKVAPCVGKAKRGKGTKLMVITEYASGKFKIEYKFS